MKCVVSCAFVGVMALTLTGCGPKFAADMKDAHDKTDVGQSINMLAAAFKSDKAKEEELAGILARGDAAQIQKMASQQSTKPWLASYLRAKAALARTGRLSEDAYRELSRAIGGWEPKAYPIQFADAVNLVVASWDRLATRKYSREEPAPWSNPGSGMSILHQSGVMETRHSDGGVTTGSGGVRHYSGPRGDFVQGVNRTDDTKPSEVDIERSRNAIYDGISTHWTWFDPVLLQEETILGLIEQMPGRIRRTSASSGCPQFGRLMTALVTRKESGPWAWRLPMLPSECMKELGDFLRLAEAHVNESSPENASIVQSMMRTRATELMLRRVGAGPDRADWLTKTKMSQDREGLVAELKSYKDRGIASGCLLAEGCAHYTRLWVGLLGLAVEDPETADQVLGDDFGPWGSYARAWTALNTQRWREVGLYCEEVAQRAGPHLGVQCPGEWRAKIPKEVRIEMEQAKERKALMARLDFTEAEARNVAQYKKYHEEYLATSEGLSCDPVVVERPNVIYEADFQRAGSITFRDTKRTHGIDTGWRLVEKQYLPRLNTVQIMNVALPFDLSREILTVASSAGLKTQMRLEAAFLTWFVRHVMLTPMTVYDGTQAFCYMSMQGGQGEVLRIQNYIKGFMHDYVQSVEASSVEGTTQMR